MNKHEYLIREIPSGNYDVFYKDVHIGHCDWKDEAIDIVIDHACTRAESAEAERDEARAKLEQAVAAEREACANVAESGRYIHGMMSGEIAYSHETARDIAAAIRARSHDPH